ncbi:TRAP transporter substrate-binding protein DctP, partial [Klebsiella pneumoniae]|uniref:TRAP transporter substrate-binding protein DctP n=1 Tax=Klebsiella pneumoniae TaxID=573 RepID=UPI002731D367
MITRRSLLATAATGAGLLACPAVLRAQSPKVLKLSHQVPGGTIDQGDARDRIARRFGQAVEQRTGGKVKVEVYPNSQLYKDKEEMEALQLGSVQMLAPSLAKFGPLGVKEFEVLDLPFLFKDTEAFRAVTEGQVGADLFKKLEPKGI